jgi:single-stranded DNA-binding protein
MSVIKKEKLTIVIGEYTDKDGNIKKQRRTIGELVTMQGKEGPYQFGTLWGPTGSTNFSVYEADDNNQQAGSQQPQQQAPQQGYQQQPMQNQYNQAPQGGYPNNNQPPF